MGKKRILGLLIFLAMAGQAQASKVYVSVIDDGTPKVIEPDTRTADFTPAVEKPMEPAVTPVIPAPTTQTTPAPVPAATTPATSATPSAQTAPKTEPGFDAVPAEQVPAIAKRLKYTNDILKRFRRAYDYRTTTLKQLKTILAELEKNSPNK